MTDSWCTLLISREDDGDDDLHLLTTDHQSGDSICECGEEVESFTSPTSLNDLSQARELGVNCSSEGEEGEAVYKPLRMAI